MVGHIYAGASSGRQESLAVESGPAESEQHGDLRPPVHHPVVQAAAAAVAGELREAGEEEHEGQRQRGANEQHGGRDYPPQSDHLQQRRWSGLGLALAGG